MSITTPAAAGLGYLAVDLVKNHRRAPTLMHVGKDLLIGSVSNGLGRYAAGSGSGYYSSGPGGEILAAGLIGGVANMVFQRHGFGDGFQNAVIGSVVGSAAGSGINMIPGAAWINGFWPGSGAGAAPPV